MGLMGMTRSGFGSDLCFFQISTLGLSPICYLLKDVLGAPRARPLGAVRIHLVCRQGALDAALGIASQPVSLQMGHSYLPQALRTKANTLWHAFFLLVRPRPARCLISASRPLPQWPWTWLPLKRRV